MARNPESLFTDKVKKDLEELGAFVEKIQQVGKIGTPDIFACLNGRFIALELKVSKKADRNKLQDYKLYKIILSKGLAYKVYPNNWDEILEEIKKACACE